MLLVVGIVLLGIDAGYSKTVRSTGICVICPDAPSPVRAVRVWARDTIFAADNLLAGEAPTSIGIDAPLTPILGQARYKVVKQYRECERMLSGGIFQKRCKPGPTNSPRGLALHKQATKVANALSLRFPKALLVEAFPNAFLGVMLPNKAFALPIRRAIKSDVFWEQCFFKSRIMRILLTELFAADGPRIFEAGKQLTNHDERAAFICAITARSAALGTHSSCAGRDGTIVLPPGIFVKAWAREHLSSRGALFAPTADVA